MKKIFWTDNTHLEEEVVSFFRKIEEFNQKEFDGQISMILLGSMSRGEASWKRINGVDTIVSDIEVLTLLPVGFSKLERLHQVFNMIKEESFPDQHSTLFHIDYCVASNGYDMSRMERKLLTYDANVYGYTVVGIDYKNTMPLVTYSNINLHDIWEILIHRIFSVLYWGKPLKDAGNIEEYRYNLAKNSLDLMTVMLINNQQLVSGFANRLEAIKNLDLAQHIKDYFEYCLSVKFSTESVHSFTISEMESVFIQILDEQNRLFTHHFRNDVNNIAHILKRYAGQIKRAIRTKHIPSSQKRHLKNMIILFKENQNLSESNLLDNYVLNGYPII